jgi:glycosyltransferase involved in cell wall biosynthesis
MNNKKKNNILWMAWERQRRSTTLAKELGADLYQLESKLPRLMRYTALSLKTIQILFHKKYAYIFAQNPSVVLCLLIIFLKTCLNKSKVIIDSHTPYLKLGGIKKIVFNLITKIVYRGADLVIVTNRDLKSQYEQLYSKTKFYVLPDKIPEFGDFKPFKFENKINILLICTYAEDEPYVEAFKAMKGLNATLYVTGNKRKVSPEALNLKPENVILTDYLSESEYISIINSVDIVMDLTEIENCMVCGAYEALAAGKPIILSNKKVLREYFNEGVIHTRNDAENIAKSIHLAIENLEHLRERIRGLRSKRIKEWSEQWSDLLRIVGIRS